MPTISPDWSGKEQVIGLTDQFVPLTGTTESISSNIDMTSHDAAHVTVEVDFGASAVNDVDVQIYGSLEGVDFDDVGLSPVRIARVSSTQQQITIPVEGLVYFRLGCKQTGATDSHGVRAYVKKRNWIST